MLTKSPAIVSKLLPGRHMIVTCGCSIRVVVLAGCCSDSVSSCRGEMGVARGAMFQGEKNLMIRNKICLFAVGGLFAFLAAGVVRADDSALLDVLVKKGILTKQEAE